MEGNKMTNRICMTFFLGLALCIGVANATQPGTKYGRVEPITCTQGASGKTAGIPITSALPMTIATGTTEDTSTDAIKLAKSYQHSIHIEWTIDNTAASDGAITVIGCDTVDGTYRVFDPAVSKAITGDSYSKIYAITIPACAFIKIKITGDTNGEITVNKLVVNAW